MCGFTRKCTHMGTFAGFSHEVLPTNFGMYPLVPTHVPNKNFNPPIIGIFKSAHMYPRVG